MLIREATMDDVPVLVEMGRHQVRELYHGVVAENVPHLVGLTTQLITGPHSVVLVADQDGLPVGMIGMVLYPHQISGALTAGEVAWWLEPEYRGHGTRLLQRAEQWAAEHGARQVMLMAPSERVGRLYERRGYQLLELTYVKPVVPEMTAICVIDDVLPEPAEYVARIKRQPFRDVQTSPGVVFHGMAAPIDDRVVRQLVTAHPELTPTLTFVRHSPEGQDEPNYIHTDRDMGEWTAIYYLTDAPKDGDGTTFWRHTASGAICSRAQTDDEFLQEWIAWRDLSQWEPWHTVAAKPNRAVLFPAPYFHSRAIKENYGSGDAARLIQVVFGTGALSSEGR